MGACHTTTTAATTATITNVATNTTLLSGNTGMDLWASPDGLRWRLLDPTVLPSWFADTQPVVFWDAAQGEYLAYGRLHAGAPPGTGSPRSCGPGPSLMRQVGGK